MPWLGISRVSEVKSECVISQWTIHPQSEINIPGKLLMNPRWLPKYCHRRPGSFFWFSSQTSSRPAVHFKPFKISRSAIGKIHQFIHTYYNLVLSNRAISFFQTTTANFSWNWILGKLVSVQVKWKLHDDKRTQFCVWIQNAKEVV